MIAVVFAIEFESAGFRARLERRLCVSVLTLGVMGKRAAPALEKLIQQHRPEIIVSAGFSGALQPGLPVGTIVLAENFSDPGLLKSLVVPHSFRVGRIFTADDILETAAQKTAIGQATGALAGDLETSHLYEVCIRNSVKMLSVRSISDAIDQSIPIPSSVLLDPESGRANPKAIFQYLFRNPSKAQDFARLLRDAKTAQQTLASGIQQILPSLLRRPIVMR